MTTLYLFVFLMLLAAVATLWLSDQRVMRMLGIASLMLAIPAIALLTEPLNWRHELAVQHPSAIGIALVALAGGGLIFVAACCLSAVLRLVSAGIRTVRAKQYKDKSAVYLDKALDIRRQ